MSTGRSQRTPPVLPPAYNTLTHGVALHDPATGTIIDGNDRIEGLFGYSIAELRAMTVADFSANTYSLSDATFETNIEAAAAGTPQEFEWRIKRADGELRWVRIQLSRTTLADSEYVLGEISDITAYKHNDRRVSLFNRLLRHNLRNEITVIAGFANHITEVADGTSLAGPARKIDTAATKLTRITESMKQVEATVTREGSDRSRRSARVAVTDVLDEIRETHPAASVSVTERTAMWIEADEAFDYALTHAVENAIVHADTDAPTVEIAIGESPNTGRVEIRIDDDAPPIPRSELDALDDHRTVTATRHGSGCGLFVMKWCLESLGGELKIEPADVRGNAVYFYLPPQSPPE